MAAQTTFTCMRCGFIVEAWDDGNPFVEAPDGKKHYFYHPGGDYKAVITGILGHVPSAKDLRMMQKHSGNDSDCICLGCGERGRRDSRKDESPCGRCGSVKVVDTNRLAGHPCPSCKEGRFDPGRMTAIS